MRTSMKNRLKKVCAFVVAFALVLPLVCGQQMTVKAATPKTYLTLVAVDSSGVDLTGGTSLEIGDTVSLELRATAELEALGAFSSIEAYLDYDTEKFKQVTTSDFTPAQDWAVYWDVESNKVNISTTTDSAFSDGDVICTLKLTVKSAVNGSTTVEWKGDPVDPDKNIVITQSDNASRQAEAVNVTCTVSNTVTEASRVFELSVPSSLTFYTDTQGREKEIVVPIKIENGSIYCGFRFGFTYNTSLVTYTGYELSSSAGAYVQSMTVSDVPNSGGLYTHNVALVSSRDINLAGEFIYLKFKTSSAVATGTAPTGGNITITLYDVVNASKAPMTFKLGGSTSTTTAGTAIETNISLNYTQRQVHYGDVNGDDKINLIDALMIMQHYNGVRTLSSVEGAGEVGSEMERADVNGSGTVTLVDALLIMKKYNGEIADFPIRG